MAELNDLQQKQLRAQVDMQVSQSVKRETPNTSFKNAMARAVVGAVNTTSGIVSAFSPSAGAVMSAAVSGLASTSNVSVGAATMSTGGAAGDTTGALAGTMGANTGSPYMDQIAQQAAGGNQAAQQMMATREMQELNQMFNLQYLQLQQKIQGENRQFTALSNVMKTKHDTAKNALSNLK